MPSRVPSDRLKPVVPTSMRHSRGRSLTRTLGGHTLVRPPKPSVEGSGICELGGAFSTELPTSEKLLDTARPREEDSGDHDDGNTGYE